MLNDDIECLNLALNDINAIKYKDSKSIPNIVNFVGEDNLSIITGFTDNMFMETRLLISGSSSYNGFDELVKPGDWILKIPGYLDTKTNNFRSKYMIMTDIAVRTLFKK